MADDFRQGPEYCPVSGQSREEEIVNGITHGVGLVLSVAALVALVILSTMHGTVWHIATTSIFGIGLVVLYAASMFYHLCRAPNLKQALRIVDHSAIFLLIAATYTPFTLHVIQGALGWTLCGVAWTMVVLGTLAKVYWISRFPVLSSGTYLALGWMALLALEPLVRGLSSSGFAWLLGGGLSYTLGIVFYAWRQLPFHHGVWHLFVMAGSACHFLAVLDLLRSKP
ncbi:MAG: hemolysin III family protein [Armatimonadetes bacterium]|nr:hemolysin III family protein [Armatimonadota bacterium]